ncbi:uncharacterized protein LOC113565807 isoform X2 [Drosophila persimilis]|uniref:uncharacterized protein LOC113565807 isoform X2 n=2 Tax=Drosophila persimilis TaxID=7234 RepID=UPI000F07C381|nr:uncharacterized protein LOC113565807 isoform X2 [Drosophila persimilis]
MSAIWQASTCPTVGHGFRNRTKTHRTWIELLKEASFRIRRNEMLLECYCRDILGGSNGYIDERIDSISISRI